MFLISPFHLHINQTPLETPCPTSQLPPLPPIHDNSAPVHYPVPPHHPLPHHTHRPPLDHQRRDLKQRIRRRHRRVLGIRIICRRHLYDIRSDEIDTFESADDGA